MNNRLRNKSQRVDPTPVAVPMVIEIDPCFYQKKRKQQLGPQGHVTVTRAMAMRNGSVGSAGPSNAASASPARSPISNTENTKISKASTSTLADSDSGIDDIRRSPEEVEWEGYQLDELEEEELEEWVEMVEEDEDEEINSSGSNLIEDANKLAVDTDDKPYIIEYLSGEGEEEEEEDGGEPEEEPEPESDPLAIWPTSDPVPAPAERVHKRGGVVPWKRKTNVHHVSHAQAAHAQGAPRLKPYKCEGCGKAFPSRAVLLAHQPAHTGERPFGCPFCDKRFTFKTAQTRHMLLHTGKPLACSTCEATFTSSRDLQVHEFTHSGERPFVCAYCPMTFNRMSALRSHTLLHTGKPHACDLCERSFTRPSQLKHHKFMHAQGRAMKVRTDDQPPSRLRRPPRPRPKPRRGQGQGRSLLADVEEPTPEAIVSWAEEDELPQQEYAIIINI